MRWFLLVGGASGTVAKSTTAYDKDVSDGIYGNGARYVSRGRLQAMLDNEWAQLISQLNKSRGLRTCQTTTVSAIWAARTSGAIRRSRRRGNLSHSGEKVEGIVRTASAKNAPVNFQQKPIYFTTHEMWLTRMRNCLLSI